MTQKTLREEIRKLEHKGFDKRNNKKYGKGTLPKKDVLKLVEKRVAEIDNLKPNEIPYKNKESKHIFLLGFVEGIKSAMEKL